MPVQTTKEVKDMSDQEVEEIYSSFATHMEDIFFAHYVFTENPVENIWMQLMQGAYTADEALLLDGMSHVEEDAVTAEQWAKEKNLDVDYVEKKLNHLSGKGAVWDTSDNGKTTYRLNEPAFYMARATYWPGEYNEFAVGLAPLVVQLMHALHDKFPSFPMMGSDNKVYEFPAHYMTVPIEGTVKDDREMLPYQDIVDLLENHWSYYSVSNCVCAVKYDLDVGSHDCAYPLDRCLHMDDLGRYLVKNGMAREVTLEEAKEICKQANEAGLFHSVNPPSKDKLDTLCNCCPDCCYSMVYYHKFGNEHSCIKSNYIVKQDFDRCIGCGKCVKVCPMDCRRLNLKNGIKGKVTYGKAGYKKLNQESGRDISFKNISGKVSMADKNLCIGCGLCAYKCTTKCLDLVKRNVVKDIPDDMDQVLEWMVLAAEDDEV